MVILAIWRRYNNRHSSFVNTAKEQNRLKTTSLHFSTLLCSCVVLYCMWHVSVCYCFCLVCFIFFISFYFLKFAVLFQQFINTAACMHTYIHTYIHTSMHTFVVLMRHMKVIMKMTFQVTHVSGVCQCFLELLLVFIRLP